MNHVQEVAVLKVGYSDHDLPLSDWAVSQLLECCCHAWADWPTKLVEDPSLACWLAGQMPVEASPRDIAASIDRIARQEPVGLFASRIATAWMSDEDWRAFQRWWLREAALVRLTQEKLAEGHVTPGFCLPVLCQLIGGAFPPEDTGTHRFQLVQNCSADRELVRAIQCARQQICEDRQLVTRYLSAELQARVDRALPTLHCLAPDLLRKLADLQGLRERFEERLEHEKLLAMKELAYGASHEINNPLANISSRAQLLLREESDPERRRSLATINSQAFRAHEMIADMMLFAKPPALERSHLAASQFLDAVVNEVARQLPPSIELRREDGATIPTTLHADQVQLRVAIQAICANAIEAMEGQGRLVIRLRQTCVDRQHDQPMAEIEIQDDGPGIPPEMRRHLFDPFYSGREAGRGLGLGLSKAWRIIQLHGGQICVDSQVGEGATFTICLPLKDPESADQASG